MIRLKQKGNIILSQDYGVESCFLVRLGGKEKQHLEKKLNDLVNWMKSDLSEEYPDGILTGWATNIKFLR